MDNGKVHLIVTSPPYGDHRTTVAYGQFSKHPGLWLGLPEEKLLDVDSVGLGGTKIDLKNLTSEKLAKIIKLVVKNEKKLTKENKKPYRADDVYAYFHDFTFHVWFLGEHLIDALTHNPKSKKTYS